MTQDSTAQQDIEEELRNWARGMNSVAAGIELLIHQGRTIYPGAPWIKLENDRTYLDSEALHSSTQTYSGGEQRVIAIAVSLLNGTPIDLSDKITGLDYRSTELVLAAIAQTAGFVTETRSIGLVNGSLGRITLNPLFTWPTTARTNGDPRE